MDIYNLDVEFKNRYGFLSPAVHYLLLSKRDCKQLSLRPYKSQEDLEKAIEEEVRENIEAHEKLLKGLFKKIGIEVGDSGLPVEDLQLQIKYEVDYVTVMD